MFLEFMAGIILEFILNISGKLYLFVRYRKKEDRRKVLEAMQDSPGSYIGRKTIQLFGIIFLLLILISLIVALFAIARSLIH